MPPIRNPGLVIKDVTMLLIEGIHYDPNEFVIQPGKDLFKQDKLLALYGKNQKLDHYQLGLTSMLAPASRGMKAVLFGSRPIHYEFRVRFMFK